MFYKMMVILLCSCTYLSANSFHIKVLSGDEIIPHTEEIVKICGAIYREYPYLYNGDDAGYEEYLESYCKVKGAIVCLAFDTDKVIGLATGMPMQETREIYQQTFLKNGYDLESLYYLGEFGVQKEYQGRGVEEALYAEIAAVAQDRSKKLCLWELSSDLPRGYIPNSTFWEKIGFIHHPELYFTIVWTNIGDAIESEHLAEYWVVTF